MKAVMKRLKLKTGTDNIGMRFHQFKCRISGIEIKTDDSKAVIKAYEFMLLRNFFRTRSIIDYTKI